MLEHGASADRDLETAGWRVLRSDDLTDRVADAWIAVGYRHQSSIPMRTTNVTLLKERGG
jgi:hypothetical protein